MDEQHNIEPANQAPQQTGFLRFLCILTFLGSGMLTFIFLIYGLFFDSLKALANEKLKQTEIELYKNLDIDPSIVIAYAQQLFSTGRYYMFINAFTYSCSLYGAILMWKLRKTGFHLYSLAQIILLILPLMFIEGFRMPFITILVTVTFIFGYSTFLRSMR